MIFQFLLECHLNFTTLHNNEFMKGNFVVCKTGKKDSAMAIDQAGEQGNKVIKSVAGGLNTVHQQNDAFRTWSIAAPEIVRRVAEYELLTQTSDRSSAELLSHHEDNEAHNTVFTEDQKKVLQGLEDAFDPFVPCTTRLCYINNGGRECKDNEGQGSGAKGGLQEGAV